MSKLFEAITKDIEDVNRVLISGCSVHVKDDKGRSPLHVAAEEGKADIAAILIAHGADVNGECSRNKTPVHYAAENGQEEVLRLLLKAGADVNAPGEWGHDPPVHCAWSRLHRKPQLRMRVIEQLLDRGADVNSVRGGNFSLLLDAVHGHDVEMVYLLLKRNARIDIENYCGSQAFTHAAAIGEIVMLRMFLDHGVKVDHCDREGKTSMHYAVIRGQFDVVTFLLSRGADINFPDNRGRTPLYDLLAASPSNLKATGTFRKLQKTWEVDMVRLLVQRGADINIPTNRGKTPLMIASEKGHLEAIHFLLDSGANLHASNTRGETALHRAAFGGKEKVVSLLLARGAVVNARRKSGETALGIANSKNRVIPILVQAGGTV